MSRGHVEAILARLDYVRGSGPDKWMAHARCHDDARASLSIRRTSDGRVLVHCFAGCDFDEIVTSLGLTARDLAPSSGPPPAPGAWRPRPRGMSAETRGEILDLWRISDHIRRFARRARTGRAWATQLGPDDPRTWPMLELSARYESQALAAEAELDGIMLGRIA